MDANPIPATIRITRHDGEGTLELAGTDVTHLTSGFRLTAGADGMALVLVLNDRAILETDIGLDETDVIASIADQATNAAVIRATNEAQADYETFHEEVLNATREADNGLIGATLHALANRAGQ